MRALTPEQALSLVQFYGDPTGRSAVDLEKAEGIIEVALKFMGATRNYDSRLRDTTYQFSPTHRIVLKKRDTNEQKKVGSAWKNTGIQNTIDFALTLLARAGTTIGDEAFVQNIHAWKRTRETPRKEARNARAEKQYLDAREKAVNKLLDARERGRLLVYLLGGGKDRNLASQIAVTKDAITAELAHKGTNPPDGAIYSLATPPLLPIFFSNEAQWTERGVEVSVFHNPSRRDGALIALRKEQRALHGNVYAEDGVLKAQIQGISEGRALPLLVAWCRMMAGYGIADFYLWRESFPADTLAALQQNGFRIVAQNERILLASCRR